MSEPYPMNDGPRGETHRVISDCNGSEMVEPLVSFLRVSALQKHTDVSPAFENTIGAEDYAPLTPLHDRLVQLALGGRQFPDVAQESRDLDRSIRGRKAREDPYEVRQRFGSRAAPDPTVQVFATRLDLQRGVDDTSESERQAGPVFADPVRVADEDDIDIADEVLSRQSPLAHSDHSKGPKLPKPTRFLLIASWKPALPVSSSPSIAMTRSTSSS